MSFKLNFLCVSLTLLAVVFTPECFAAVPDSAYGDLHWRQVGPFRGGWATAVEGHPDKVTTFYFGSADGGVWKTDNAGVSWQPLFEQHGSASVGALSLAPSNPDVIWIGTGQIQQRWDIADGDGVYRSTDGGQSWQHVGLGDTRHIGDLWVDPGNEDIAKLNTGVELKDGITKLAKANTMEPPSLWPRAIPITPGFLTDQNGQHLLSNGER